MFKATKKFTQELMTSLREMREEQSSLIFFSLFRKLPRFPRELAENCIRIESATKTGIIEIDDTYIYLWDLDTASLIETAHISRLSRMSAMMMVADMLGRNGYIKTHTNKIN